MSEQNPNNPEQNPTPVDGENDPKDADPNQTNPNPNDTGNPGSSSTGESGDDGKGTDKNDDKSDVDVPEKYELKAPEGIELDQGAVEAFTPIAKELKLNNDQAQKLADLYTEQLKKVHEAQQEQYLKTLEAWEEEAKKDPEIGGDKFEGAVASAKRALKAYDADGAFLDLMEKSGFGNHPAVMRFVSRVGKALKEDTADTQSGNRGQERDINKILYNS